jgi:hypothetical protein
MAYDHCYGLGTSPFLVGNRQKDKFYKKNPATNSFFFPVKILPKFAQILFSEGCHHIPVYWLLLATILMVLYKSVVN